MHSQSKQSQLLLGTSTRNSMKEAIVTVSSRPTLHGASLEPAPIYSTILSTIE